MPSSHGVFREKARAWGSSQRRRAAASGGNLLTNARDALDDRLQRCKAGHGSVPPGWRPQLVIAASAEGTTLRLAVSDNGGGIPEAVIGRVFEPFFTTKETGRGTGIGLAIAKTIVDRHGGRLEVDNHPGEGVTFTLVLPAESGDGNAP